MADTRTSCEGGEGSRSLQTAARGLHVGKVDRRVSLYAMQQIDRKARQQTFQVASIPRRVPCLLTVYCRDAFVSAVLNGHRRLANAQGRHVCIAMEDSATDTSLAHGACRAERLPLCERTTRETTPVHSSTACIDLHAPCRTDETNPCTVWLLNVRGDCTLPPKLSSDASAHLGGELISCPLQPRGRCSSYCDLV